MFHYYSLRCQMFFCTVFALYYHLQANQQAANSSFTKLLLQMVIQNCDLENPYCLDQIKDTKRLSLKYVHRTFFDYSCLICLMYFTSVRIDLESILNHLISLKCDVKYAPARRYMYICVCVYIKRLILVAYNYNFGFSAKVKH